MSGANWCALLVAAIGAVVLFHLQRRHVRAVRRDRAGLFASAVDVLDEAQVEARGLDFPVLHGTFEGRSVRVEPVVDTISLRIVPVLRLVVTTREQLVGQSRISVLSDETGQEFYAQHRGMVRLRDPGWPARVSVACAAPEQADRRLIEVAVDTVSGDASVKQVLITDRGVRCVVRAGQSDVATYRVTRRVDLSGARVPAELLRNAVRTTTALCERAADHAPARPVGLS